MGREEKSYVRKRRHGCLGGCLTKILLLLGVAALLFVGACVLGFVRNDPVTGAPSLTMENIAIPQELADSVSGGIESMSEAAQGLSLPSWAYGVAQDGLTVKTLRAGEGEAVLVCCGGYTMLVGGGSGMGVSLTAQLLLCGVGHLNAVIAPCAEQAQIHGLPLAMTLMPPEYLLYQDSQVKGTAYNRLLSTVQKNAKTQTLVPRQGLTFSLGGATVTVVGPAYRVHTDERDDGLSVRVDYGGTSVLIAGSITAAGEQELVASHANLDADVLICARGGSDEATGTEFVSAVSPSIAVLTGGDPANSVQVRLMRAGAQVHAMQEHGVITIISDGQTIQVKE